MPLYLPPRLIDYPNGHRDLINAHFGSASADLSAIPPATRFVFICFTNRCGSHFLADGLTSSGILNYAGEMFNAETIIADSRKQGLADLGQYVGFLVGANARNGFLVAKISVTQLAVLAQAGILDHIASRVSYIVLEREDKLGQAISYALALRTGRWTSEHESTIAAKNVEFSRDLIESFIRGVIAEIELFQVFFGLNGITPLHISYEMLDAMPAVMIPWIGERLGLRGLRFVPAAIRFKRQSDETNWIWREKFLSMP